MNKNQESNDTFLSEWLADNISDAQLQQLVPKTDFDAYLQLRRLLQSFAVPDADMQANYASIKAKRITANNTEAKRIFPLYGWATIAATLLLFFGLYQVYIFSSSVFTDFGKTMAISLDDDSKVVLNAKSEVSYPLFFRYNRTLKLAGEAFFEVAKGKAFTVETPSGKVEVLGTKFNVISRPGFFEVICFEGRVKVSHKKSTKILTQGDAIRFYENTSETWRELQLKPLWINGESSVRNLPLKWVIHRLANQYQRKIVYPQQLNRVRFTGSFTHRNLETALQSICIPLNLNYSISNSGTIILSE